MECNNGTAIFGTYTNLLEVSALLGTAETGSILFGTLLLIKKCYRQIIEWQHLERYLRIVKLYKSKWHNFWSDKSWMA